MTGTEEGNSSDIIHLPKAAEKQPSELLFLVMWWLTQMGMYTSESKANTPCTLVPFVKSSEHKLLTFVKTLTGRQQIWLLLMGTSDKINNT